MKKSTLLGIAGLLLAAVPVANAQDSLEKYTGKTTDLPDGAIWANAGTAPGLYTELYGTFDLNLTSVYQRIGNTNQLLFDKKGWVVNETDEMVYTAECKPVSIGMRNMNWMDLIIPEADKITTPGKYWLIFPTGVSWDAANQGQLASTGQWETIYNLKAGPYVVGEIKDAVDAEITVVPQGNFDAADVPGSVRITVDNASMFNCGIPDELLTVTLGNDTIIMEPGVKSGNAVAWEFPLDWNKRAGTYKIFVDYSTFSGLDAANAPLKFPDGKQEYSFVINEDTEGALPEFTLLPDPAETTEWPEDQTTLRINLVGYGFRNATGKDDAVLTVVNPANETKNYEVRNVGRSFIIYTVDPADFKAPGVYHFTAHLEYLTGVPMDNTTANVKLRSISFEYNIEDKIGVGVDAIGADSDADAEFYNLCGVKVSGDLLPGIYVKVANGKSTKVIVR